MKSPNPNPVENFRLIVFEIVYEKALFAENLGETVGST